MSASAGTFFKVSVSAVSSDAAINGNAAFFAPPIGMTPSSGTPPLMQILSIASISRAADRLGRRPAVNRWSRPCGGSLYWRARRRSSRRPAAIARFVGTGYALLLQARLFLAPPQVVAQGFGQPIFTRRTLAVLPRRVLRRLVHPAMQRKDTGS